MNSYLSDDEEIIYTNDDLELNQDLELSEAELLEIQKEEEEYLRQEALDEEENRKLWKKQVSNISLIVDSKNNEDKKDKKVKKEKTQKKKGLTLEEFNKKIEDSGPKKFVSQRLLQKNPELANQSKQKEVHQTNMRRFNPRLPPYLKRSV